MEIVNLEVFDKVVTVGENIHYVDFFDGKQRVLLFTSDVIQANNLLRVSAPFTGGLTLLHFLF